MRFVEPTLWKPLFDFNGRPAIRLIIMASGTSVGRFDFLAQVGPRNAETVIATTINDHVETFRHMAIHAGGARFLYFVKMMLRRIIQRLAKRWKIAVTVWTVALGTKAIVRDRVWLSPFPASGAKLVPIAPPPARLQSAE